MATRLVIANLRDLQTQRQLGHGPQRVINLSRVNMSDKGEQNRDKKEKYLKLEEQLKEGFEWPQVYMFKFIVPADNKKIAKVENLFNSKEATINLRQSRKGNFVSVTAKEMMMSPEKVIDRYLEAEEIEGLISL